MLIEFNLAHFGQKLTMFLASISLVSAVMAQNSADVNLESADEDTSSQPVLLEEVLVTAQKKRRAESVQDVPLSVAAFTGDLIEENFIDNVQGISAHVPNVELNPVGSGASTAAFYIRGMGTTTSQVSVDPNVGIFIDGMYLGTSWGLMRDIFDLESIEVLRGPQGTLFGRNVSGGAVLLTSRLPSGDFGFRMKAGVGSYDRYDLNASIEGKLTESLFGKVSVLYRRRGDVFDNVASQLSADITSSEDVGEYDKIVVRPILSWVPSDNFRMNIITEFGNTTEDPAPTKVDFDKPSVAGTTYPELRTVDDFEVAHDYVADSEGEWTNAIVQMIWDTDNGSSIKSITSYRDMEQSWPLDDDGTPDPLLHIVSDTRAEQEQFSQEITYYTQLGDRADLTAGVYYFEQEYAEYAHLEILYGSVLGWGVGEISEHSTWAVYAQSDINISDKTVLTLGGRYTDEKKEAAVAPVFSCGGSFDGCEYSRFGSDTWSSFTPNVALQYRPTDNTNYYLRWSKGIKSGGFQVVITSPIVPIGPYDEETVTAIEAGLKGTFFDGRLRANIALFDNDYEDLQRVVVVPGLTGVPVQAITNAADATIRGIEVELSAQLTDNLVVNLASGVTDASYDRFDNFDLDGDGVGDPEAKNLDFAHVPDDWNHSFSMEYSRQLSAGQFSARTSYSYLGDRYAQENNDHLLASYSLWDASVAFVPKSSPKWTISAYVRNIGDELTELNGDGTALIRPLWVGDPRTYGIEVGYEF